MVYMFTCMFSVSEIMNHVLVIAAEEITAFWPEIVHI